MAWRVLEHADQRWNVSIRGTEPGQRSVWADYPLSSSSKAALFVRADRISDDDLIALLVSRLG